MMIYKYQYGQLMETFTDNDIDQVNKMCIHLDNPHLYDAYRYETETNDVILFWRMRGVIHGNVHGVDECMIPEESISNGRR